MTQLSSTLAAATGSSAASRRAFIPLFLTLICSAIGHAYFVITFPAMAREYSLTDMQAGFVMGGGALVLTLAAPFWGWICDADLGYCFTESQLGQLEVALVATNLTNEEVFERAVTVSGVGVAVEDKAPRYIGVRIGADF